MDDENAVDPRAEHAREVFEYVVRRFGRPAPASKVLAETLTYDGDCWTAAWAESRARGGRYVEGSCRIGNHRVRAHAWVEVPGPFGDVLVECTAGYEAATHYRGVAVDNTPGGQVDRASSRWPHERVSVIEALAVVEGIRPHDIPMMVLSADELAALQAEVDRRRAR